VEIDRSAFVSNLAVARKKVGPKAGIVVKPGSVLVDIAVDQGGCVETTRPTTHADPTYIEEGIVHYCVANMPGAYARTATEALTNVTYKYVEAIANNGLEEASKKLPELVPGLNLAKGTILSPVVAETFRERLSERTQNG